MSLYVVVVLVVCSVSVISDNSIENTQFEFPGFSISPVGWEGGGGDAGVRPPDHHRPEELRRGDQQEPSGQCHKLPGICAYMFNSIHENITIWFIAPKWETISNYEIE